MRKRKETTKKKALDIAAKSHRAFNSCIQIEDYLRAGVKQGKHTYFLTVETVGQDALGIEIKPLLSNGDKEDEHNSYLGYVMRFNIEPKRAIDNLMKFLREKPLNEKIL